jgi:hypothetical protein
MPSRAGAEPSRAVATLVTARDDSPWTMENDDKRAGTRVNRKRAWCSIGMEAAVAQFVLLARRRW